MAWRGETAIHHTEGITNDINADECLHLCSAVYELLYV